MMSKTILQPGPWLEKLRFLAKDILPYQFEVLNDRVVGIPKSHSVENYRIAAGLSEGKHEGMLFQDSDLAKWLEAAAYSLHLFPDSEMECRIEEMAALMKQAMEPDGYLDTYYQCNQIKHFTNIAHGHELYCMGHMIEAAVAHYEETGRDSLLELAKRAADHLIRELYANEQRRRIFSGHPEIETALMQLYRVTGDERYAELAAHLLDVRGTLPLCLHTDNGYQTLYTGHWYDESYHQAHAPVREQLTAEGHAVRAVYLYRAMAQLYRHNHDEELLSALDALYENICQKRMYVTGSIGSEAHGERFSLDYDLPNDRAYAETCASIGMFLWAWEMAHIKDNASYADLMEWELYNGILSGIAADGKHYFYVNPLEVDPAKADFRYDQTHVEPQRVEWFGCACCPPNVIRLLLSLYRYVFRQTKTGFAVEQFISSSYETDGSVWTLETDYPRSGCVCLTYAGRMQETEVKFRIPAWCNQVFFTLNGSAIHLDQQDGYAILRREWAEGDQVEMKLLLKPRWIYADPRVSENVGKVCLGYGPMVYCFEESENGTDLHCILPETAQEVQTTSLSEMFEGLPGLRGTGYRLQPAEKLYSACPPTMITCYWTAVPYHLWGNRGKGEMRVWMNRG